MDSTVSDKTGKMTTGDTSVSYVAFESTQARWERSNRRLIFIIGILIALLFASNCAWLMFMYGTDFESYDSDVDSQGGNVNYAYVGDDMKGDLTYGAGESESAEDNAQRCKGQDNENAGQNG